MASNLICIYTSNYSPKAALANDSLVVNVLPPARRDQSGWCREEVNRMVAEASGGALSCVLQCEPPWWGDMRPLQRWCSSLAFQVVRAAMKKVAAKNSSSDVPAASDADAKGEEIGQENGGRVMSSTMRRKVTVKIDDSDDSGTGVLVLVHCGEGGAAGFNDMGPSAGFAPEPMDPLVKSSESFKGRKVKSCELAEVSGSLFASRGEQCETQVFDETGIDNSVREWYFDVAVHAGHQPGGGRSPMTRSKGKGGGGGSPVAAGGLQAGELDAFGEQAPSGPFGEEGAAREAGGADRRVSQEEANLERRVVRVKCEVGTDALQDSSTRMPCRIHALQDSSVSLYSTAGQASPLNPIRSRHEAVLDAHLAWSECNVLCDLCADGRAETVDFSVHDCAHTAENSGQESEGARACDKEMSESQRRSRSVSAVAAAQESGGLRLRMLPGGSFLYSPCLDSSATVQNEAGASASADTAALESRGDDLCAEGADTCLQSNQIGMTMMRPICSNDTAAAVKAVVAMCAARWLKPAVIAVRHGARGDAVLQHVQQCVAAMCSRGEQAETVFVRLEGAGDEDKVYGGSRCIRGGLLKAIDDVTNPNIGSAQKDAMPSSKDTDEERITAERRNKPNETGMEAGCGAQLKQMVECGGRMLVVICDVTEGGQYMLRELLEAGDASRTHRQVRFAGNLNEVAHVEGFGEFSSLN
jgi:hypothetical protein